MLKTLLIVSKDDDNSRILSEGWRRKGRMGVQRERKREIDIVSSSESVGICSNVSYCLLRRKNSTERHKAE